MGSTTANYTPQVQQQMGRPTLKLKVSQFETYFQGVFFIFLKLFLITGCLGSSNNSMDKNSAECTFERVYPRGEIHWYQGDSNLTYASKPKEDVITNGFYIFRSEVPTEKGKQSQPYNCSLWMPSLNRYIASQLVGSSGIKCQLQWICIMMGILMMSFGM